MYTLPCRLGAIGPTELIGGDPRPPCNGNMKAPPLLTGLLSLDRNGCSASQFARRSI